MKKSGFFFLLFFSLFTSALYGKTTAKVPKDIQVWIIDAERAKCEGVTTMQCLLIKKQSDKDFNLFYEEIEGFTYEAGFTYTLWVKEELKAPPIPADASMYNYKLIKVVSKKPIAGYSNTTTLDNKKPLSGMNVSTAKTLIINEEKVQCEGNPDTKCLLIKEEGKKEFEVFYQDIEGFLFQEGYRQTILVNERHIANPMVKQAEPIYTLVSVLKKEFIYDAKKLSPVVIDTPKNVLDKKWFLRKIQESDTTSFEIADNAVWLELNTTEKKLSGKAPCNTYFGRLNANLNTTFEALAVISTKMYCDNMKFEELYFTLLQNASNFKIENGKLMLYKGKRLLLIFE